MPAAASYLGFIFGNGMVGTADHTQAYIWYSVAAERFPAGQDKDLAERERRTAGGQLNDQQAT